MSQLNYNIWDQINYESQWPLFESQFPQLQQDWFPWQQCEHHQFQFLKFHFQQFQSSQLQLLYDSFTGFNFTNFNFMSQSVTCFIFTNLNFINALSLNLSSPVLISSVPRLLQLSFSPFYLSCPAQKNPYLYISL